MLLTSSASKQRLPSSEGGIVTFHIERLAAHTERALELDTGRHPTKLIVSVTFMPDYLGLGPVPQDVQDAARLTLYATDRITARLADYRYQEDISFTELASASDDRHRSATHATMPELKQPDPAPLLQFSAAQGVLFLGLFAYAPLGRISVVCRAGSAVPHPISILDDMSSVWRVCRMYNVNTENYAMVVDWLRSHRTALILRTTQLVLPDTDETVLHVICADAGDPRLARLFAVNCTRFVGVEHEAKDGSTALHRLLAIPGICDPKNPRYYRCLELMHLLVVECGAPLDKQGPGGTTLLHLACRGHRLDSQVLPMLLAAGGKLFASIRDRMGRNALDVAMEHTSGLSPAEVAQVEKLLSQPPKPVATRTVAGIDRLPDISLERLTGGPRGTLPEAFSPGGRRGPPLLNKARLLAEFRKLDRDERGWLTLGELKRVYMQYDHYGVVTTDAEVDMLVESLGLAPDGKVSFEEFTLLVLKMTRR